MARSEAHESAHLRLFRRGGLRPLEVARRVSRAGFSTPDARRHSLDDANFLPYHGRSRASSVARAKLPDERPSRYLEETLIGRRNRFFQEYLSQYVALAGFRLARRTPGKSEQSLCFEDLAIVHGVAQPDSSYYQFRFHAGRALEKELGWVQFMPDERHPSWSCALPRWSHSARRFGWAQRPRR